MAGRPGGGLAIEDYAQFCGLPNAAVLHEDMDGRRLRRPTMVHDVEPYADYYLFLDPDKGINMVGHRDTRHVSAEELAVIARARNGNSVLVYGPSLCPGRRPPEDPRGA